MSQDGWTLGRSHRLLSIRTARTLRSTRLRWNLYKGATAIVLVVAAAAVRLSPWTSAQPAVPGIHVRDVSITRFPQLADPGVPTFFAVERDGAVLLADRERRIIRVVDRDGNLTAEWGPTFDSGRRFGGVGGIAALGSNVFVVDTGRKQIVHLDSTGRWLGELSFEQAQTYGAGALAIDAAGKLYLADTGGGRVLVFSQDGALVRVVGARGTGSGQMRQPMAVAIAPDGALYAADFETRRIMWWGPDGVPGGEWQTPFAPFGVAVDALSRVYVPEPDAQTLHVYTRTGDPLADVDDAGPSNARLSFPNQVEVGADDPIVWVLGQDGLARLMLDPPPGPAQPTGSTPRRPAVSAEQLEVGVGTIVVLGPAILAVGRLTRSPRPRLALAGWAGALLLAAAAQLLVATIGDIDRAKPLHLIAMGIALVSALLMPRTASPQGRSEKRAVGSLTRRGVLGAAAGAFLLVAAVPLTATGAYGPAAFAWFAGVIFSVAGAAEGGIGGLASTLRGGVAERPRVALVLLIALVTLLLRLVDLGGLPPDVHGDEGAVGIEARKLLTGRVRDLFGLGWYNIPNFSFAIQAGFMRVAGDNLVGLRLASVVQGTLTVLFTFLLVQRLFGRRTAAIAASLLAVSEIHVHYSRIGITYMQAGLSTVILLYLLLRALDRRRALDYVLLGFAGGLSLLVYAAARLAPVLAVAYVVHAAVRDRSFIRVQMPGLVVAAVAGLLFAGPIGVVYSAHPEAVNSRFQDISVLGPAGLKHQESAYGVSTVSDVLRVQVQNTLQSFLYTGESSDQYGHRAPLVDPWTGALLVCGVGAFAVRFRHPSFFLLSTWLWLTLLFGSVLTVDAPFSPHLVGMLPLLAIFPALFLDAGWRSAEQLQCARARPVFAVVSVGLVLLALLANARDYLEIQTVQRHPAGFATVLGRYVRDINDKYRVYLISRPETSLRYDSTLFLAPELDGMDLHDGPLSAATPEPGKGMAFLVEAALPSAAERLAELQQAYPRGREEVHQSARGELLFTSWLVDPAEYLNVTATPASSDLGGP